MAATSTAEQRARASDSPIQVDSRADLDSSTAAAGSVNEDDQESSHDRSTIASCKACNTDIAKFFNGWIQITVSSVQLVKATRF
jgi:hypothetical protein